MQPHARRPRIQSTKREMRPCRRSSPQGSRCGGAPTAAARTRTAPIGSELRPRAAVGGGGAGRDGRQLRTRGATEEPRCPPIRPAMGNAESVLHGAAVGIGKCGAAAPCPRAARVGSGCGQRVRS